MSCEGFHKQNRVTHWPSSLRKCTRITLLQKKIPFCSPTVGLSRRVLFIIETLHSVMLGRCLMTSLFKSYVTVEHSLKSAGIHRMGNKLLKGLKMEKKSWAPKPVSQLFWRKFEIWAPKVCEMRVSIKLKNVHLLLFRKEKNVWIFFRNITDLFCFGLCCVYIWKWEAFDVLSKNLMFTPSPEWGYNFNGSSQRSFCLK